MTTLTLYEAPGSCRFRLHSTRQECRVTVSLHGRTYKGSQWPLQNFIPCSSHHIRCLRVSERYPPLFYKTLHVYVCTREWLRSGWMFQCQTKLFMYACMDNDLWVPATYALQPNLYFQMCESISRKNYKSLSWHRNDSFGKKQLVLPTHPNLVNISHILTQIQLTSHKPLSRGTICRNSKTVLCCTCWFSQCRFTRCMQCVYEAFSA